MKFGPFLLLSAVALLAACASPDGTGRSVEYRQGAVQERALPPTGTYTVQRGDTIYGVARQFNLSVRALIDANGLKAPFQLMVGQALVLPSGGDYLVVKGDTLIHVARKTGVPFATLARLNQLSAPYVLQVGQKLKLPATGRKGPEIIESPAVARAAPSAVPSAVPSAATAPPPAAAAVAGLPPARDGYRSLAEREAKPAVIPPPDSKPVESRPAEAPAAAKMAAVAPMVPPPKSGHGFIWPVKGEVIGEFGTSGKGQHNDGINIKVPLGTPVAAAEDGVVAYAGNELRGFGNLLLIKHADGWMTAYAHNQTLLVKRGETVKRGQKIAKAGDSGGIGEPQLHFEIRQGTRAVDPQTLLGGKTIPAASPDDPPDPG